MDNKKNIEADKITINKTTKDEENVKIDINKKEKKVEVNVNKNGTNEKIQIGLKGIKIKDNDGEKVNIQFIPIFLFVLSIFGGFLFFIYKVLELIFR